MVFSEEGEDLVVSNQSNLDLINVKYKSKLTKLTSCIFFISDQDTGSIYFLWQLVANFKPPRNEDLMDFVKTNTGRKI